MKYIKTLQDIWNQLNALDRISSTSEKILSFSETWTHTTGFLEQKGWEKWIAYFTGAIIAVIRTIITPEKILIGTLCVITFCILNRSYRKHMMQPWKNEKYQGKYLKK